MPVATALAEDAAPEVRAAAARRAGALCDAFGPKRSAILVDEVHSLVEDADVRVRCAAARALPAVARAALRGAAVGRRFGALDARGDAASPDPNADARAALAAAVGGFLDMLCADVLGGAAPPPAPAAAEKSDDSDDDGGETSALDRAIFPLLLILVNDEVPDVACTALRALASAGGDERLDARCAGLRALLEPHHVAKLVLSLQDLATSRHWRVRAAAVAVVPALAPCCAADRALRNLSNLANGLSLGAVDEPVVRLSRGLATPHFASPGDRRLALDAATRLGDDGDPDVSREAKIASKVLSRRKKDPLAAALANLAV
ncbi:hypothetical protein JL722_6906 [Aureococcus anophagefferens]|nr:hypothetical protein JL722_6906 [Aureococcus anophagefferens]